MKCQQRGRKQIFFPTPNLYFLYLSSLTGTLSVEYRLATESHTFKEIKKALPTNAKQPHLLLALPSLVIVLPYSDDNIRKNKPN